MSAGPPIILVGTQRSGTTWLGHVFERHPRLAYWPEPRHVWTWGNSYRRDDVLEARHARPGVVRHIRKTFDEFVASKQRDRFCEKTPSNCLRLSFIRKVYPDARIMLVVRDGRSVIRSTDEVQKKGMRSDKFMQRLKSTPLWEWPAYAPRAFGSVYGKITGKRMRFWGPRPTGWQQWVKHDHPDVILAKQWAATISRAVDDGESMNGDGFLRFHYEDLMREPRETMSRIVEFCELADADDIVEHVVESVDPSRMNKWRQQLDEETLERHPSPHGADAESPGIRMVSGTEQTVRPKPEPIAPESPPEEHYVCTDADLEASDIITDPVHSVASVEGQGVRDYLVEGLWQYLGQPLMRVSFHNWYGMRARLLRLFGGDVHPTARVRPSVDISHPWRLTVGAHTAIGDNAVIFCRGPIEIGRRCTISQYAHLCSATYDYTDRNMHMMDQPILIEDDVWIAADVFVGPGVTIGTDTVVGSRSTVMKSLPPRSICVGDVARRIAERVVASWNQADRVKGVDQG